MHVSTHSLATLALVVLVPILLAACGGEDRVTKANYDRVSTCMSSSELLAILGEPADSDSSGFDVAGFGWTKTTRVWCSSGRTITLTFVEDRVVAKAHEGL
jgi:hypothetical protein